MTVGRGAGESKKLLRMDSSEGAMFAIKLLFLVFSINVVNQALSIMIEE
jgi:hypothetical protein